MWNFIQNQVLGMQWLDRLIGSLLQSMGVDTSGRWGSSLRFFVYDTLKITILLCVMITLIGYIQSYFPPERSKRILGGFHGLAANGVAALLGTVTPFCSCSSIPLFIGFTTAGLPLGVSFSFLISSPMVDLGSLVLLMSIFGPEVAAIYVVFGLVLAVAGGSLIERLHMERYVEDFVQNMPRRTGMVDGSGRIGGSSSDFGADKSERTSQTQRWTYARDQMIGTLRKVFPYILVGVGIGAVIHDWIPEQWVEAALGGSNPIGVVLATLLGVPMYADIFGTIPIAQALLSKGAFLGVVLSFMMAVTTLSLPSLIMLRKVVKPRLLAVFIGICVVGIIVVGYLFNMLQPLIM